MALKVSPMQHVIQPSKSKSAITVNDTRGLSAKLAIPIIVLQDSLRTLIKSAGSMPEQMI
jgi:hypothetical protein